MKKCSFILAVSVLTTHLWAQAACEESLLLQPGLQPGLQVEERQTIRLPFSTIMNQLQLPTPDGLISALSSLLIKNSLTLEILTESLNRNKPNEKLVPPTTDEIAKMISTHIEDLYEGLRDL
ncbi:MAG: hypothetical protein HY843_02615, partial [Bdellovibrio sp.]|nr:hypothetical protein [Bdellovibrio sp.]